jgi:hypothetical protein
LSELGQSTTFCGDFGHGHGLVYGQNRRTGASRGRPQGQSLLRAARGLGMRVGAMLRLPTSNVTETAKRNLDRFRATSAASELEDDSHTWAVVEWSWAAGPPLRVQLRSDAGQIVDFVMDVSGVWRMRREPQGRAP